ncbi:hypothetical protein HZH68_012177 [Vespula germanica]|uniref:Carboxypeptidase n=1 Tax=Vespula germanica TaxID=30212 RepID=A0A834MZK9_VESGE|nr:hypothetical protein HZH68_012177 [Vespula germanica]
MTFSQNVKTSMGLWYRENLVVYFLSISRNLIYIDNPLGTGYSFTRNDKGYVSNETQIARDIHNALNFSQNNNFFVIGESYSGKYVLTHTHTHTHTHISILMNANLRCSLNNLNVRMEYCF